VVAAQEKIPYCLRRKGFLLVAETDELSNLELINDVVAIYDLIAEIHILKTTLNLRW
jgi:hypothetical protein